MICFYGLSILYKGVVLIHNYEKLIQKIRRKEVVLWVGAGFSRYAGIPVGRELTDIIKRYATESERSILKDIYSLPELAEEFVKLRSGSKTDLFSILKNIFNISVGIDKLYVHDAVKSIPQIDTIVTTNYDTLFEQVYKNDIEVIIKDDSIPTAFTSENSNKVKLLKIHSDFSNQNMLVLTSSDYRNFFGEGIRRPIWTEIKSIIAKKAILFIGYSLEDTNVQFIFDEILKALGDFSHECFLVTPNLPEYKQNSLILRNIAYIDMTAEEIIPKIKKDIKESLLEDCNNGLIDHSTVIKLLQNEGINAEYRISKSGSYISSIGALKEDVEMNVNINFQGQNENKEYFGVMEKISDLINGKSFEPVTIPGEFVGQVNSTINAFIIDSFSSSLVRYESLHMTPYPIEEYPAHLYFEGFEEPENVMYKRYESRYLVQTEIVHNYFKIAFKFKLNNVDDGIYTLDKKLDFSIELLKPMDVFSGNKIIKLLLKWFDGLSVSFYKSDDYKKHFDLPDISHYEGFSEFKLFLRRQQQVFSSLLVFQRHFNVNFNIIESITENDVRIIANIKSIIDNNGKLSIQNLEVDGDTIRQICINSKDDTFVIDEAVEERQVISLFGANLELGYPQVQCTDAYVENYDEINLDVGEVKAIIRSKSNNLYIEYSEMI